MKQNFFDLAQQYDAMLTRGIRLSGEDKRFFIVGRLRDLRGQLPPDFRPRRVLDYGCGIGDTAPHIAAAFPGAEVVGVDTSEMTLAHAEQIHGSTRFSFRLVQTFSEMGSFDLCYVNGVFHHIPPSERPAALRMIHGALAPGRYLAFFENNPWNPGMQIAMSRIPFDRGAQMISPMEARGLLGEAGFELQAPTRYLFYFPRALAFLRFMEPSLARIPLGAQYCCLGVKRPAGCRRSR
jgi:trans-aconitate methyltransferase